MGTRVAERLETSTQPEMKPSMEVPADEIAKRTDGSLEYFRGEPSRINYPEVGAMIDIDEDGRADKITIFREGGEIKFELNRTVAILGEGFVTFVEPIYRHNRLSGTKRFSWITVSEKEGITARDIVVKERERYPEVMQGSGIPEAAHFAEKKFHPGVKYGF